MRIALDATYSIDPHPSGIAVYSRSLLAELARLFPGDDFLACYRPKQFRRSHPFSEANVHRRLLLPPLPTFHASLFHALNQRVDRRSCRSVISTFHDLFVITGDYSSAEFRARFTAQARNAAENSDAIIAVSQFTADQVASLLNVPPSRVRVVPHGVRPPATRPAATREKIILFTGALQRRKNLERLIEAFELLPTDWRLVLAGAPSGYQVETILQRIEKSKCRNRIEVTGYLTPEDLERFYFRASLFAFPSLDEGFGMPVLEAMSHGIPVVTSRRSALPEVAGDAALLVDPENTEELHSALLRLIEDTALRDTLVQRGLAHVQIYTWERAARATHQLYLEI